MAKRKDADTAGTVNEGENVNGRLDNQEQTPAGKQGTDQLGMQVRPETQLDEDNGNRTLSRPKTDPGPIMMDENGDPQPSDYVMPSRDNGFAPHHKLNPAMTVVRRTSTAPDYFMREPGANVGVHGMSADHAIHSGASDMYHKEGRNGDGRDPVREKAEAPREVAPKSGEGIDGTGDTGADPFAPQGEEAAAA